MKFNEGQRMFLRNEFRAIDDGGWGKRLTLPGFVFLAMLGVAFATSGLRFLQSRMDDPFVKWVDFPVTMKFDDDRLYDRTKDSLDLWSKETRWGMDKSTGFFRYSMTFHGFRDTREGVIGRTMNPVEDTVLMDNIFGKQIVLDFRDSLLEAYRGNEERMWRSGIVMEEELYRFLFGEDRNPRRVAVSRGPYLAPVLDVVAVVKRLPSRSAFFSAPELQQAIVEDGDDFQENTLLDSTSFWVRGQRSEEELLDLADQIQKMRMPMNIIPNLESVQVRSHDSNGAESHRSRIVLKFDDALDLQDRRTLFTNLSERYYQLDPLMGGEYVFPRRSLRKRGDARDKYNWFSLGFTQLDSIQQVSEVLMGTLGIELDLNKVESLKNFNIVSVLTNVLGLMLLVFAVAAVAIFINNLVKSHLNHIKQNLGTFRAFGVTRKFMVQAYALIIGTLLARAVALGFSCLLLIEGMRIAWGSMKELDAREVSLMSTNLEVFSGNVLGLVVILFAVAIWTASMSTRKVLRAAPGDLIYNRI